MRTLFILPAALALACASSNPTPDDGGTTSNNPAPNPPASDAGNDSPATPAAVNGCTTFTDMTASGATITGPSSFTPAQYSPSCVHIKAGQSVTWKVALNFHPLGASGGDSPSPIESTSAGETVTFTFATAGTYGYHCMIHPTLMFGAVLVTP